MKPDAESSMSVFGPRKLSARAGVISPTNDASVSRSSVAAISVAADSFSRPMSTVSPPGRLIRGSRSSASTIGSSCEASPPRRYRCRRRRGRRHRCRAPGSSQRSHRRARRGVVVQRQQERLRGGVDASPDRLAAPPECLVLVTAEASQQVLRLEESSLSSAGRSTVRWVPSAMLNVKPGLSTSSTMPRP